MAEQSLVSEHLWLLDGTADFIHHSLQMVQHSRRDIAILSRDLDADIYNHPDFIQALSQFARSNRYAQVHILVKNTKPAIEQSHGLIRLAQRLTNKIHIKQCGVQPENSDMAFMLCDSDKLLYKNDDNAYRGFANYRGLREVKSLREQFNYLWQYASDSPECKRLFI